jgi:hypothetical protein
MVDPEDMSPAGEPFFGDLFADPALNARIDADPRVRAAADELERRFGLEQRLPPPGWVPPLAIQEAIDQAVAAGLDRRRSRTIFYRQWLVVRSLRGRQLLEYIRNETSYGRGGA